METTNLAKHSSKNPLQQLLINNFNKELLACLRKVRPKKILDVGCGEGFTLQVIKNSGFDAKLEGVDAVEEAVELAHKIHPGLTISKGDIYTLPYKDNSFDVIICSEVLEHLTDPQKALTELKRITSKYLILSVPNEPYFTIQRILRGKNILGLGAHPEHVQWWTHGAFQKFVSENGLKLKRVKAPFAWTLILAEKSKNEER